MKLTYILFAITFLSCKNERRIDYYKSISKDKKDTAVLNITIEKSSFFGKYQIKHHDNTKDSGTITGSIFGDTLKGRYTYISRDNIKTVDPIAFLNVGKKLKLGNGDPASYMSIPYYMDGTIYFNDSLLQFQPIKLKEYNMLNK
ncbi:hypothetical protein SD427_18960 (plasmid) [Chryseobacterium sp. JJR-5R]|uniref:hypothetical protein n=1 Tax=Chryseobacterium sp. JJR-5R TaxID=3093923 RepID=UPI002A75F2FE|nr:hypothetical protein [Chryseobacterium sp. JJR-5R]WPO84610.1 hypothetical protein SD427_18960 [Chryseobacterium sp. JJR-5R]